MLDAARAVEGARAPVQVSGGEKAPCGIGGDTCSGEQASADAEVGASLAPSEAAPVAASAPEHAAAQAADAAAPEAAPAAEPAAEVAAEPAPASAAPTAPARVHAAAQAAVSPVSESVAPEALVLVAKAQATEAARAAAASEAQAASAHAQSAAPAANAGSAQAATAAPVPAAAAPAATAAKAPAAAPAAASAAETPALAGAYTITPKLGTRAHNFDIHNGSTEAGAEARIYKANGTLTQDFAFTYDAKRDAYTITNYKTGLVLDAGAQDAKAGSALVQRVAANTPAQLWKAQANSDGTYSLVSLANNLVLDIEGGSAKDASRVVLSAPDAKRSSQRFYVHAVSPNFTGGVVNLRTAAGETLVTDVHGASYDAGAAVEVRNPHGGQNQKVTAVRQPDGSFVLSATHSGMRLGADGSGKLEQQAAQGGTSQKWRIEPTDDGHFAIERVSDGAALAVSGSAKDGARLGVQAASAAKASDAGRPATQKWNLLATSAIQDGWYSIRPQAAPKVALDVTGFSFEQKANIQLYWYADTLNQLFYLHNLGGDAYEVYSAWSLQNLDVAEGNPKSGTNVRQFKPNGAACQTWYVSAVDGGVVFDSALGTVGLSVSKAASGGNVNIATTDYANARHRFVLAQHDAPSFGYAEQVAVSDYVSSNAYSVFRTRTEISDAAKQRIFDAVNTYESDGYNVGFFMMDLKTGAGIAYNTDQMFRSASTIKGPYILALNKWWADARSTGVNEDLMWIVINQSPNVQYLNLVAQYGHEPLDRLLREVHAEDFRWDGDFGVYTAKSLGKMWLGMTDYFRYGTGANADWCRLAYSVNDWIESRGAIGNGRTVYAKSGWLLPGAHNEGCFVDDPQHPYIMAVMSNVSGSLPAYMNAMQKALDAAHDELVR